MPERSFGRTVRYRRTKLGLSQAQLGELVGRSASSIRSWERDISTPTDASVITALSAILDLDQRSLFTKAGLEMPSEEAHPTLEEALASLSPLAVETAIRESVEQAPARADEMPVFTLDESPFLALDVDSELEAEVREHGEVESVPIGEQETAPAAEPPHHAGLAAMTSPTEPGFVTPPEPFLITTPTPPVVEPSYMEDVQQRQLYRVRNLATIVLIVALLIILLWSASNAVDAIGAWWADFFGGLRL
jgi:transcriptional regulator with XRE-family HTH domain